MGENDSLAKRIVCALGGNWYGYYGTVPGPGHSDDDRSVTVRNHQTNRDDVCIYSHAGDDVVAIKAEWRARGILSRPSKFGRTVKTKITTAPENEVDDSNVRTAWWLWHKLSQPGPGTVVTEYLKWRGLDLDPFPPTIRFLPPSVRHPHPAMICAARLASEPFCGKYDLEPNQFRGVHITYLQPDGRGKAAVNPPRRMLGRIKNAPFALIPPNDGNGLLIAEGIESALAGYLASGLGIWAAGSATLMPALVDALPSFIECVTVFVEADAAGRRNAEELMRRIAARGIEVREWRAD